MNNMYGIYIKANAYACVQTALRLIWDIKGEFSNTDAEMISICAESMAEKYGIENINRFLKKEIDDFKDGEFYAYAHDWAGDNVVECQNCGTRTIIDAPWVGYNLCQKCSAFASNGGYDHE